MNILFAGTPDPSARILDYLIADSSINVIGVLTQPDKPQKRGKIVAESPVSNIAYHNKIKTFKPDDLNDKHLVSEISALDIDILLVAAYGKILPKWLLLLSNIFPVNIHYSLLPKYRGASPIQTSLLNDDEITGVTFMKMSEGLDEGNIIKRFPLKIEHKHNKILLENDLCSLAINNLSDVISLIKSDKLDLERQDDSLASFCSKIDKADSLVDFHSSASDIFNKHRAYYEWPGTAFIYKNIRIKIGEMSVCDIDSSDNPGKILKFDTTGLYLNTNTKAIVITYLQFPGKKMISCSDAFNAYRNFFE